MAPPKEPSRKRHEERMGKILLVQTTRTWRRSTVERNCWLRCVFYEIRRLLVGFGLLDDVSGGQRKRGKGDWREMN